MTNNGDTQQIFRNTTVNQYQVLDDDDFTKSRYLHCLNKFGSDHFPVTIIIII